MNIWDIVILLAVLGIVLLALRQVRKTRKSGGCSCGCGCSGDCGACSGCGKKQ